MFKLLTFISYPILKMRLNSLKKKGRLTTLCFHNVSDNNKPFYPHLSPKVFEHLLKFFSKHFEVVNFTTISANKQADKPLLILSFDDAYLNYYEVVFPLLEHYNMTSVLNVITSCPEQNQTYIWQGFINYFERIGPEACSAFGKEQNFYSGIFSPEPFALAFTKHFQSLEKATIDQLADKHLSIEDLKKTPMMNWDQIKEVASKGHEIGAHTHNHYYLKSLNDTEIKSEIERSKSLLEQQLNQTVTTFCFPGSQYNEANLQLVKASGFKNYLLVENKTSEVNSSTIFRYLIYGKSAFRVLLIALGIENYLRGKHA